MMANTSSPAHSQTLRWGARALVAATDSRVGTISASHDLCARRGSRGPGPTSWHCRCPMLSRLAMRTANFLRQLY
jgi:hypothetical protein